MNALLIRPTRSIMMAGTSPAGFNNQSPSFHSSSYLPKMEANFMRDFTCCGLTLANLHDVLQHFEEVHADAPASRNAKPAQGGLPPTSSAQNTGITPGQTQTHGDSSSQIHAGFQQRSGSVNGGRTQRLGSDGFSRTNLSTVQDMDSLDDMEMDDVNDGLATIEEAPSPFPNQQNQFNQSQGQLPPLNVNLANTMQNHQGMHTSTPTTPAASQQFNLQNNPTVSSVNTPTLGTVPMQNAYNLTSPESSHPGTPAELDMDFVGFNQPMMGMQGMDMNFGNTNFGAMAGFDGTIDQPGKRLFSKQGGGLSQQQLQAALKNYQLANGDQNDMAKRMQQQQMMNGANVPQFPFPEEVKPFRCPVIGCEKAYKNQNGLKYHKQVCCPILFFPAITMLTFMCSTVTKISSSRRTRTAPSPSWTLSRRFPTPEPSAWRRRSRIAARCAANGTRTSTASNTTEHTHPGAIPNWRSTRCPRCKG